MLSEILWSGLLQIDTLDKQIEQAVALWQGKYLDSADFVLLLPHTNTHFNALLRSAFTFKLGDRCGVVIKGKQADKLLLFYSLYAFTDKLIIGSFDLPNGRKLHNLIDSGIATESELINDVILGAM